jgi:hypothetical protein
MVREIVRTWCMKDSKVGPQQAKQRAEIAHLFEMCRGYDVMAVKAVLVKVSSTCPMQTVFERFELGSGCSLCYIL